MRGFLGFVIAAALASTVAACGGSGGADPDGGGGGDDAGPGSDGGGGGPDGDRVFDLGVLHTVSITVEDQYLEALDNDTEHRVPCAITYDDVTVAEAGIKKKGTSSQRPLSGKPGFSIKLNEYVSGQKLDGLKKLLLDAGAEDPTYLTGHLGYEVSRRAGVPAPRTAHAIVRFNGEVKGIYTVEEAVTTQWLEATYGDGQGDGNLYEGPWDFTQGADSIELKDEVSEMRSRDDIEALTAIVLETPDAELADALATRLDIDEFITNYAIEVVAAHWDSYAYAAWNFYLYDRPSDGKFVILPHGLNWPYWHADLDPFDLYAYPWGDSIPPGRLCERLRGVPALDAAFRAEVRRVADVAWDTGVLDGRIAGVTAILEASGETDPTFVAQRAAYFDHVDEASAFVAERKAYLRDLLDF